MSEELSELGVEIHYLPIRVNEKILLHLGRGIYPSVAAAIKELVHNAFDADAKQVVISTGYPAFDEIQILDTGHGMSLERFKMALVSIGNSMKDTIDESRVTKKYKRPIIGRLGIGLMALSQVCNQAMIESQLPGLKNKFSALIHFTQFQRDDYENTSLSVLSNRYGGAEVIRRQLEEEGLKAERQEELKLRLKLALEADKIRQSKEIDLEDEHLGHCWFIPELPGLPHRQGTTVTLLEIRPEIKQALMDRDSSLGSNSPAISTGTLQSRRHDWEEQLSQIDWSWRELCEKLRCETDGLTYQVLPSYHQFLYELALMSPVPYLDDAPISSRPDILREKKRELKRFNFSLRVDNHLLYKPILLPSGALAKEARADDYLIRQISFNGVVDTHRLKYHGYLYWQKSQNKPSTLHGIQLYIRNVGIGLYDQTFTDFSKMYSTNFAGHISGEIYVERGLEQALNVDRQSFRETDPHYIALQQHLLGECEWILRKSIEANERRKRAERQQHLATVEKLVSSATNGKLGLNIATSEESEAAQAVSVDDKRLVFNPDPSRWTGSKAEQLLGQKILLTTKAAVATGASTQDLLNLLENILLK